MEIYLPLWRIAALCELEREMGNLYDMKSAFSEIQELVSLSDFFSI